MMKEIADLSDATSTVYLVSCVSQKRTAPAPARDLYVSPWFLKARAYVERTACPWFILSAEYGLVSPEQVLAPYDKTLNTLPKRERQAWAARVKEQMRAALPAVDRVVVLAGLRYREFLMEYLRQRARTVEVPMEGLGIGRQLRFLSAHAS